VRKLEWFLLMALAFGGVAWVIGYAERFEPLTRYGPIRSAGFYEDTARKAASEFGVDVAGWASSSSTTRDGNLRLAWERNLVTPSWRLRSPYTVTVRFFGPKQERCNVTLDYTGNVLGFARYVEGPAPRSASAIQPRSAAEYQIAREIALAAFREKWRTPAEAAATDFGFHLTADAVTEGDDIEFEWTSNADPAGLVAWRIELRVRDGDIRSFELAPLALDRLREVEREAEKYFEPAIFIILSIGFVGVIWAAVVTILNLFRKRLPWGFAIRALATVGAVLLVSILSGAGTRGLPPDWYLDPNLVIRQLFSWILNSGIAAVMICAGRSTRMAGDFRRWLAVEDFLRLDWAKASVPRSFWTAALLAMLWVGLPYLVTLPFPLVHYDSGTRQALGLAIPFANSIAAPTSLSILFATAFCFPYVKAYVKWRPLRGVLALLLGTAAAGTITAIDLPVQAGVASSLAYGALMVYSYARFGVLASVLGGIAAIPLSKAIFLSTGGDAVMQSWGIAFLSVCALATAVALVLDFRNPDRELDQALTGEELARLQQESQRDVVSKREQLLGEFALAQQAQQRMLPSKPPFVEGFEISAHCQPAQQVGGDLFDYIRLHDGRWACCVADVSGKGVSAAVYMTFTKGLLSALRLERGDLTEIATILNQRLHEVLRRRSFVTMAVAALDPLGRTIEVLRAGHLPMLHVSGTGETRYVAPRGMGLGLAPSTLFCRNLNTERIRMENGEVAVLYSDGVTEAMNAHRQEFGEDAFAAAVVAAREGTAIEIRDKVLEEIGRFRGSAPVHDDITVVVIKAGAAAVGAS
jgi:serine phosphatase RsbU (regulator of sigma subunit)